MCFHLRSDRNLAGPPGGCFSVETEIQTATYRDVMLVVYKHTMLEQERWRLLSPRSFRGFVAGFERARNSFFPLLHPFNVITPNRSCTGGWAWGRGLSSDFFPPFSLSFLFFFSVSPALCSFSHPQFYASSSHYSSLFPAIILFLLFNCTSWSLHLCTCLLLEPENGVPATLYSSIKLAAIRQTCCHPSIVSSMGSRCTCSAAGSFFMMLFSSSSSLSETLHVLTSQNGTAVRRRCEYVDWIKELCFRLVITLAK